MPPKRKLDSPSPAFNKRLKITTAPNDNDKEQAPAGQSSTANEPKTPAKRHRINKLVPPRPYPTVPTSVSATGPRSAHKEGKNLICITRKTKLGAYMRRCKDMIIKDGYKTLHLSAMGAAVPLLLQLATALPPILPFAKAEIGLQITTGTVEVQDEVIPDDEDEDISYQTRGKSTLTVVMKIGDGEFEGDRTGSWKKNRKRKARPDVGVNKSNKSKEKGKAREGGQEGVVFQEPEQEDMEML